MAGVIDELTRLTAAQTDLTDYFRSVKDDIESERTALRKTLPLAWRNYWVDETAPDGGDGSKDSPFNTLLAATNARVKAGVTAIHLLSDVHISQTHWVNDSYVIIRAVTGAREDRKKIIISPSTTATSPAGVAYAGFETSRYSNTRLTFINVEIVSVRQSAIAKYTRYNFISARGVCDIAFYDVTFNRTSDCDLSLIRCWDLFTLFVYSIEQVGQLMTGNWIAGVESGRDTASIVRCIKSNLSSF